jgi:hypothetical protein
MFRFGSPRRQPHTYLDAQVTGPPSGTAKHQNHRFSLERRELRSSYVFFLFGQMFNPQWHSFDAKFNDLSAIATQDPQGF